MTSTPKNFDGGSGGGFKVKLKPPGKDGAAADPLYVGIRDGVFIWTDQRREMVEFAAYWITLDGRHMVDDPSIKRLVPGAQRDAAWQCRLERNGGYQYTYKHDPLKYLGPVNASPGQPVTLEYERDAATVEDVAEPALE